MGWIRLHFILLSLRITVSWRAYQEGLGQSQDLGHRVLQHLFWLCIFLYSCLPHWHCIYSDCSYCFNMFWLRAYFVYPGCSYRLCTLCIFWFLLLTLYILVSYTDFVYSGCWYGLCIFWLFILTLYILVAHTDFAYSGCSYWLCIFWLLIRTLYILVADTDFVYSGCSYGLCIFWLLILTLYTGCLFRPCIINYCCSKFYLCIFWLLM